MNIPRDAKKLAGLLFHGTIHCLCTVADKSTGGATNALGITPLLQSLGQDIAGSMAAEHFKELFSYNRLIDLVRKKQPGDLNHDLEDLFRSSAITAIGYIKLLLEAEMNDVPEGVTIKERQEMKEHLNIAAFFLVQQQKFLKSNPDLIAAKADDLDNSSDYLQLICNHVLFYQDDLPEVIKEKLAEVFTTQLPWCFQLAFYEALKEEKNGKGFRAFQLRYMDDSKALLKDNTALLVQLNEKTERLLAGHSLVDEAVVIRLFQTAWSEAAQSFSTRFDGVEALMKQQHERVFGKLEVMESKLDLLAHTIPQLIALNEEKDNEIKELRLRLEEKPDAGLQKVLTNLLLEKNAIQQELQKSDELVQQQAKDKADLEKQLMSYKGNDELKTKAFEEVEKKNYDKAEEYLKESAKDQIAATAQTFYELGKVNKLKLNYREALRYFDLAVKIDGERKNYLYEAADLSERVGYYDDSVRYLEKLVAVTGEEQVKLAVYLNDLGLAFYRKGEYDKAIVYYESALTTNKKFYGEEHPDITSYYNNLGEACRAKGEYEKAIGYYERSLEIGKRFYGEEHPSISTSYNNLGGVYRAKGEDDKAIGYYKSALTIDRKLYGEEHPNIAAYYNNLGGAYRAKGEYEKAIGYYERALAIDKKFYGEEHPNIATRYNNLGAAYYNKMKYDKAIWYYEKSLEILVKFLPSEHPYIAVAKENLALAVAASNASGR
ncbi:MAG: tetratricopeptide repeat protein [Chitinophagaceae bacterium]|nr:tetratricopeptide repeat protein [Chitinophagaceae bacterium]